MRKIATLKISILLVLLQFVFQQAKAQDTAAMVKEFNKILSFAVQPHLYYSVITRIQASPVMQPTDTATLMGEFFKNGTDIYYNSGQEKMFLDDKFHIQVNQERKSIWISKVDAATKDKMNLLPLTNKNMQQLFRKKFQISKEVMTAGTNRLNFASRQADSLSELTMNVAVQYYNESFLPQIIEMNLNMKQRVDGETISRLSGYGVNTGSAVVTVSNNQYFVRNQKVSLHFDKMDNTREKAMQIPSWKTILDYNGTTGIFSAKGVYSDYEITKTF